MILFIKFYASGECECRS